MTCFLHPGVMNALSDEVTPGKLGMCENVLETMSNSELIRALTRALEQIDVEEDRLGEAEAFKSFTTKLRAIPQSHYVSFCSLYRGTVKPCVEGLLFSKLPFFEGRSEGCCVNMNSLTSPIIGKTLSDFGNTVLDVIDELMCNKVATGQDQTCGYTMVQGLTGSSLQELNATLHAFVQIPQDQACKAYTGQQFTSTKGSKAVLAPQSPLGNCATGLDDAFTLVKEVYEFAKTSSDESAEWLVSLAQEAAGDLSQVFAPGKCMDMGSMCMHFPTEFSKTCGFSALSDDPNKVSTASRRTAWWSVVASLGVVALSAAALYF